MADRSNLNKIGDQAESYVRSFMETPINGKYHFDLVFLGGKWETADLYVEIRSPRIKHKAFFFIQVKGSTTGFNPKKTAVKTKMKLKDLKKFSKFNAPTYLIAVNVVSKKNNTARGFINTIRGDYAKSITRVPVNFELTQTSLINLKEEVVEFWSTLKSYDCKCIYQTNFKNN